ncbi:hypothetical protein EJ06DRAFT_548086 [Trichodelitschia bisporula]|uniref:NAD(P)-binding domain-containing protein n=1 Tax=Trichodelitschia bisporula TaxID=703511 RepID=A0A6G1I1A9_9PEZI|nr:hypothetical protein EJ06DRAFT_548086 [Trichodelitschia bisporula]
MTSTSTPTQIAVFGATGGCAGTATAHALKAGYKVTALARTPSKLRAFLETQHTVPAATLDSNLTIVEGAIQDAPAVLATLTPAPSTILFGIGAIPKLAANRHLLKLDDPHICSNGIEAVLAALRTQQAADPSTPRPFIAVISTTGLSARRDVPLLLYPLYHVFLAEPHVDKRAMEAAVARASVAPDSLVRGFVVLRPTLLTDGRGVGTAKVRAGWERHPDAPGAAEGEDPTPPAMGYAISRADVGAWIWEEVLRDQGQKWAGNHRAEMGDLLDIPNGEARIANSITHFSHLELPLQLSKQSYRGIEAVVSLTNAQKPLIWRNVETKD